MWDALSGEDARTAVRAVVDAFVLGEHPGRLGELDEDFEVVFSRLPLDGGRREVPDERGVDGLPFDGGFVAGALVASAVWVAATLVRALGEPTGEDVSARLDRVEATLAASVGDRELVAKLRRLVEGRSLREAYRVEDAGAGVADVEPPASPTPSPVVAVADAERREPDLRLLVREGTRDGRPLLSFTLLAADPRHGPIYGDRGVTVLRDDPGAAIEALYGSVEELIGRPGDAAARRRLARLGGRLATTLLPADLRADLAAAAADGARTLQVLSAESWIPWDLLWLDGDDAGDEADDDAFLGARFALARWLADREPALDLPLARIAVLVPEGAPPGTVAEASALVAAAGSARTVERVGTRYLAVTDALESGRFDAFHFAGHGSARGAAPDRWSLALDGVERLDSADLVPGSLAARRPLVVLNACHSGRGGLTLTGVGGLARAFADAGAGVVVGCHWAVADAAATLFAGELYRHVFAGVPLGESVRGARLAVRRARPGDPSWLAYTLFGHPGARAGGVAQG